MKSPKTRCSECLYAKSKAYEEPCSKCAEIQHSSYKYENHFISKVKNLLKEGSHE